MNIAEVLLNNVRRYPEKLALICGDTRLTYKVFNEAMQLSVPPSVPWESQGDHFALLSRIATAILNWFSCCQDQDRFYSLNCRLSPRNSLISLTTLSRAFFAKEYLPSGRDD
jgi:hypothetical protein